MGWSKIIATYLVIAQLVLAPVLSHAQDLELEGNKLTKTGKENFEAYAKYANGLGYDSRLDLPNKRMLLIDRNTKKVSVEIPLRDEKSLLEYSPKTLNQKLATEFIKVRTANAAAWSHTVKSFPTESTLFFLALGGMVAVQLFTDYANNPVGMKQHIEHQLSPVGQLGFFMFMYSQGVTSNALNLWLKNPKLKMPIGMLGMTVGLAVQTYFSQVVSDPHIRNCAASVFKGEKIAGNDHPCEGAYKYFVLDKKILEGPGVASLLGAFLITTGARIAVGSVLRLVGFEIGMWIVPGGMVMRFGRLLVNATNIAAFTLIQMKLEHYVSYAWKNYFDGKKFIEFNDALVANIENQKKSAWQSETKDFNKDIQNFSKKMSEWRVNNLSEAYAANQAWSEFLNNLTSMYSASYNFYSLYLDSLNSKNSLIDRSYPLFGVIPKGLAIGHEDLYFLRPDRIERLQVETTNDVAAWIGQNLQSGYYENLGFIKYQMDIIAKIQAGLASENIQTKGSAILELNAAITKSSMSSVGPMGLSSELRKIYSMLGTPNPIYEVGRGFGESMLLSPNTMSAFKDLTFEKHNGRFNTPNITDYFVIQMMCGPDTSKGEKVISIAKGYPAKFNAPTVTLPDEAKESLCYGAASEALSNKRIYNLPFSKYRTVPEFLRANMNPEVSQNFIAWWEKGTESQMREAFKGFSSLYKSIINKLYAGLNQTNNSRWNRGFISNGALVAAFQEIRLYSLILGEMLKDSYKEQNKKSLPSEYYSAQLDPKITISAADYMMSKKPLLGLLARGSRYDFNTLVGSLPNADVHSLKVQNDLELSFVQMNNLIQKAGARGVKAEEFQNQMKAIEAQLSQFSLLLGVSKGGPRPGLVTLGIDQKALAVTCLELLQSVSQELAMYGNMAGTARYQDGN